MASTIDERLAQTFVELADTMVAGFDLMDFLHTLTDRCADLLGSDAAVLLLADSSGVAKVAAASPADTSVSQWLSPNEDAHPCLECCRTGRIVAISDLRSAEAATRWPQFAAAAAQHGISRVDVIPMRLREETIGALAVCHTTLGQCDPSAAAVAKSLVDVATIGLLQERALRRRDTLAEQLQSALDSRVPIEQAKGVLAERYGITPDQAFAVLRRHARNHNRTLTNLAGDVVDGSVQITHMSASRSRSPSTVTDKRSRDRVKLRDFRA